MSSDSLGQPIKYPGELVARGQLTDCLPPTDNEQQLFEEGLSEIEEAERQAAAGANRVLLTSDRLETESPTAIALVEPGEALPSGTTLIEALGLQITNKMVANLKRNLRRIDDNERRAAFIGRNIVVY